VGVRFPPVLCAVLTNLNIEHEDHDSLGQLRRKLKRYILQLHKGKDTEREQCEKHQKVIQDREQLESMRQSWPQLVPQSLKNKTLRLFRKGALFKNLFQVSFRFWSELFLIFGSGPCSLSALTNFINNYVRTSHTNFVDYSR
jgi:hypothetical protein